MDYGWVERLKHLLQPKHDLNHPLAASLSSLSRIEPFLAEQSGNNEQSEGAAESTNCRTARISTEFPDPRFSGGLVEFRVEPVPHGHAVVLFLWNPWTIFGLTTWSKLSTIRRTGSPSQGTLSSFTYYLAFAQQPQLISLSGEKETLGSIAITSLGPYRFMAIFCNALVSGRPMSVPCQLFSFFSSLLRNRAEIVTFKLVSLARVCPSENGGWRPIVATVVVWFEKSALLQPIGPQVTRSGPIGCRRSWCMNQNHDAWCLITSLMPISYWYHSLAKTDVTTYI